MENSLKIGRKEYFVTSNINTFIDSSQKNKTIALKFRLADYMQKMRELNGYCEEKSIDFIHLEKKMDYCCTNCGKVVPKFVQMKLMGNNVSNVGSAQDWTNNKCPQCGDKNIVMFLPTADNVDEYNKVHYIDLPLHEQDGKSVETSKRIFKKHKKLPYVLVGIIWSIFSIWLCVKENQISWMFLLILLGFLPYLTEFVLFKKDMKVK